MKSNIIVVIVIVIIIIIGVFGIIKFSNYRKGEIAAIDLYKNILDDTLKNTQASSYEYVSININSLINPMTNKVISQKLKNEILNYCKKYNKTIITHNENDLLSKDSRNRIFVTINLKERINNQVSIIVKKTENNSNSGGINMTFKYLDNKWVPYGTSTVWNY